MTTRFDQSPPFFQPAPDGRVPKQKAGVGRILGVIGALFVAFLVGVGVGGSNHQTVQAEPVTQTAPSVVTSTVAVPGPTVTVAAPAPAARTVTAAPEPLAAAPAAGTSFTSGTYQVGVEIKPGNYATAGGTGCYWARLKSNDGEFNSIITNGIVNGPSSVSIKSTDKYIEFTGDCTWTKK